MRGFLPMLIRRLLRPVPLIVSCALHSALLVAAVGPWSSSGARAPQAPAIVLVDLFPSSTGESTAGLLPADGSETPPTPAAVPPPAEARLEGEVSELSARLQDEQRRTAQLEAEHRQEIAGLQAANRQLGDEVAALAADRSALAAQVEAEQRRTAALDRELTARRQVEQAVRDELNATYDRLVSALSREIASQDVAIERGSEGLTVAITDLVLFPSGQATLTPVGEGVIDRVGAALRAVRGRPVLVEGHTDNVPVGPALRMRFASNWELSTARATEVVKRLIGHGDVAGDRLRAVGRADTEPVASNEAEEGRRRNRRIEIILLPPSTAAGDPS